MKILVGIASHGSKNREYLDRLLMEYRSMPYPVDIVVLSDLPKDLGAGVEIRVGCPANNPRSLPFGHKALFAERVDRYDLFVYSEDDTLIQERNIRAFCEATRVLPQDQIAGFLRYEVDACGRRYYSSVHSHFHWMPDSVRTHGPYTFARFTNDHAASYLLTRSQLKRAIHSGGYLVEPHNEKYDLLETAATDPYTQCGLQKVICISHIEDFVLHHLPNQYIGRLGLESAEFDRQIAALLSFSAEDRRDRLFQTETNLIQGIWSKEYYEPCREDILAAVPETAQRVLSVGCGWGATEGRLVQRGVEVAALPLDAVIGACARARGVKVTPPNFTAAFQCLAGKRFDGVILSEILHHLPDPVPVLSAAVDLMAPRGVLIASVPDFHPLKISRDLLARRISFAKMDFYRSGMHFTNFGMVKQWFRRCGLERIERAHPVNGHSDGPRHFSWRGLKERFASPLILVGRKA